MNGKNLLIFGYIKVIGVLLILIKKLIGYRGWKVWISYDLHIVLLSLFYVLIVDTRLRLLDSLILISSIGFYFMYGFLINDFCDMSYDIAAGKKKAVHEIPKIVFIAIILLVVFISVLHLLYLKEPFYIVAYIVSSILATLYSMPPIRFKSRGFSGIVVDGLIEKTLPVLMVFTFFHHFSIDTLIFLVASFSIGTVEIVTHQIYDYESDSKTGVRTFAVNTGLDKVLRIYRRFVCPFSGAVVILLCFAICTKIPYSGFITALVFITYVVIFVLITKGELSMEENVFPLYMSCLFLLIHNAFPLFFAFILSLENASNIIYLLISIGSQYYVIKYRFKAIKERIISHTEIFVDT